MPMTISLYAEERPPLLRRFVEDLADALEGHARVWASLVAGDEDTPQSVSVFVDVYGVPDEEAALIRVEPAIREVDPDLSIVRADATPNLAPAYRRNLERARNAVTWGS